MSFKKVKDCYFDKYVSESIPEISGLTIVVTGTSSGTGFWTSVAALRKRVKTIIMLNRGIDTERSIIDDITRAAAIEDCRSEIHNVDCDLSEFDAVEKAAKEVLSIIGDGEIDVLINNAGVCFVNDIRTVDGFEMQMQVNFLSHVLLMKRLWPLLERSKSSRVVFHSSNGRIYTKFDPNYFERGVKHLSYQNFFGRVSRYCHSKRAMFLMVMAMHKILKSSNSSISVLAADPGTAASKCGRHMGEDPSDGMAEHFLKKLYFFGANYLVPMQSAADGCLPLISAAFLPEAKSGDFFSPKFGAYGLPKKLYSEGKPVSWTDSFDDKECTELFNAVEKALGESTLPALD